MEEHIELQKDEAATLREYYKTAPSALMRERAHCALLCAKQFSAEQIADILFRDTATIQEWITKFLQERTASIFHHYTGNRNAAKLTKQQDEEVKKILSSPPSAFGLPGSFWTPPKLKHWMTSQFGVIYESERSYHYLLEHAGYSWKLPETFDRRRNEEFIETRMKEIHQEMQPLLKDSEWIVLAADESKVTWETEIRRAWCKTGETTIVKDERKKEHQNYFGALNLKNGKHHLVPLVWQNAQTILEAMTTLVNLPEYKNKRICVLWDNASWHKNQTLREALKKGNALEQVHLIAMPPYAPDMNPEEHVWKYGKDAIANEYFPDFRDMQIAFEKAVTEQRMFDYRIPEFVLR